MKELEDSIIIGKGCKKSLIKDLEAIVRVDDLLVDTFDSVYSLMGDKLGPSVMSKYDISQRDLQCNFMLYKCYQLQK